MPGLKQVPYCPLITSPPHHLTTLPPLTLETLLRTPPTPPSRSLLRPSGCTILRAAPWSTSSNPPMSHPPRRGNASSADTLSRCPPPPPLPPPHLPAPPRTSPHLQPQCTSEGLLCRLAVTGDQAGLRHALVGPAPARVRVGRRLHAPLPAALPAPCRAPLLCHGAGAIVPTSPQISPLPRSPPQSAREAGGAEAGAVMAAYFW